MLGRSSLSAGSMGLLLVYLSRVTVNMNMSVRQFLEAEAALNSVERTSEYSRIVPEEVGIKEQVPAGWPNCGNLSVSNLTMRYRADLDCVLKGVTFDVPDGFKVGIAGRTGSGKSSLLTAIFRLVEPEPLSVVLLDGIDVSKIKLKDLRSKISIIPQDPTLFSGTIRTNLDPFGSYSDEQIWAVLAQVQLADSIKAMPGELDSKVSEA